MTKISFGILVSFFMVNLLPAADSKNEEWRNASIARSIDAAVDKAMSEGGIPGMIVDVWKGGRCKYFKAKGFADLQNNRRMKKDITFRIASVTKTFTTTLILMLFDEGLLDLDDPISKYDLGVEIPNEKNPMADEITIRQICNHTSGLYDYWDETFQLALLENPTQSFDPAELIQAGLNHDPYFNPGEGWHYSNTNFIIQQVIIETVSGKSMKEVMKEKIFEPLKLRSTFYPDTEDMPLDYCRGYLKDGDEFSDITFVNPSALGGAGAIISSIRDLKIWAEALAKGNLLKITTLQDRLEWVRTGGGAGLPDLYGLGICTYSGLIGHTGGTFGYSTWMTYLPSQDTAIIFMGNTNSEAAFSQLGQAILDILYPDGKF